MEDMEASTKKKANFHGNSCKSFNGSGFHGSFHESFHGSNFDERYYKSFHGSTSAKASTEDSTIA